MSYCRWLEGDVYVWPHVDGGFVCDDIWSGHVHTKTRSEMIEHLRWHIERGHDVPDGVIEELQDEIRAYGEEAMPTPWGEP